MARDYDYEPEVKIEEGYRFHSDIYTKIICVSKNFLTIRTEGIDADIHELMYDIGYVYCGPTIMVSDVPGLAGTYAEVTYRKMRSDEPR